MVTILAGLVKVRRIDDWVMLLARIIMDYGSATPYALHIREQFWKVFMDATENAPISNR